MISQSENAALQPSVPDLALALASKAPEPVHAPTRRQKGPKGPNPLSVKKKKPDNVSKPKHSVKGKERMSNGAVVSSSEQESSVGKRKHNDANEEEGEDSDVNLALVESSLGEITNGHRRKRRRKRATGGGTES